MHNGHRISTLLVVGMLAAVAMSLSGLVRAHSAHEKPPNWEFSLGAGEVGRAQLHRRRYG